jgi:hypothetical protein
MYHHNGGAGRAACGQMKRELALLHGTLSLCGVFALVTPGHTHTQRTERGWHSQPCPSRLLARAIPSASALVVPPRRIITSSPSPWSARIPAAPIHHACFSRAALTTRAPPLPTEWSQPCPPGADRRVAVCVCMLWKSRRWWALCRAPTCPDIERPLITLSTLITLIGPSQWSHLDRSRRSPYTLA